MGGFPIAPQTPFGVIRGDCSGVSPLECLVPGGQFVRYGSGYGGTVPAYHPWNASCALHTNRSGKLADLVGQAAVPRGLSPWYAKRKPDRRTVPMSEKLTGEPSPCQKS